MILKLQRSQNDGGVTVLAYDRHRRFFQQFPCHESVAKLFDDVGREKVYVVAHADRNRILKIDSVIDDQDW